MVSFTVPPPGLAAILLTLAVGAAGYDICYRRIPNWLTGGGVLAGVLMNTFLYQGWPGLSTSMLGLAAAFCVYLALYSIRAMGAGDVKMMAAVGAIVGWQNWVGIFLITAILGGVAAMAVVTLRGRIKRTLWNVGFAVSEMKQGRPAYLRNEELDVRSSKALGLPHGAVIAAGVIVFVTLGRQLTS
jgi:prepilin peptidase CpaA